MPLADCINNFFIESIRTNYNKDACSRIPNKTTGSVFVFFYLTDPQEVFAVIISLRKNSSTDVEGLPIKAVKFVADSSALQLCHNLSLESSVFPARMKLAKVTVVFKSGSKDAMDNYRPISILPALFF